MTLPSQLVPAVAVTALQAAAGWFPPLGAWLGRFAGRFAAQALQSYLSGDLPQAERLYGEAAHWHRSDRSHYASLGQVFYEQGKLAEAEAAFREALVHDYENERALKGLALVLQEREELLEAMYIYLRYLELKPEDGGACHNLGAVFHNLGNFERALEYYDRAEQAEPDDTLVRKNRALALFALGRYEEAAETLDAARKLDPEDAEIDRLLGLAYEARGNQDAALASYRSAVGKNPEDAEAHLQLASILSHSGASADAVRHASISADLFRKDSNEDGVARARWDLGWHYYVLGDYTRSVASSSEAAGLRPDYAPVHFNLGLALLHLGRTDEARSHYRTGIERLSQVSDLKVHAIDDLREALDKDASLAGATEILSMLESEYAARSTDLQTKL